MKQYRVTKYDPAFRTAVGAYTRDEWTAFSDVGTAVSLAEYERVEAAYLDTAVQFFTEQAIASLTIVSLENPAEVVLPTVELVEGTAVGLADLTAVVRGILRERYWAKLEGHDAFLHVGWDYYMYIGVPARPTQAIALAEARGLFVEDCPSPYAV